MNFTILITICLSFSIINSEIITHGYFKGMDIEIFKQRLGFINFLPLRNDIPKGDINEDLPSHFDAREKWGKAIHPIRDQAHCGSCWAFGATEALSDRFAINGVDVILSPQDMVSCNKANHGCNGGNLVLAWTYLGLSGAVTEDCFPYASQDGHAPQCVSQCVDSAVEYKKYMSSSPIPTLPKTIEAIKTEIFNNGPVETGFSVYEDFLSYTSGVYIHKSGKLLGGHAVKLIGWGKEGDVEYWIAANSWSEKWGEHGFFKIEVNQCGISSQVTVGLPKV
jgi:cathepsin B